MPGGDPKLTEPPKDLVRSAVTSHDRPGERITRPSMTGLHAAAVTPTPVTLTQIGRYQIVTKLATGGMAEVYLAVHGEMAGFRTPVVVKKVLPHLACNPQFIDMFLDEARIASLLDHPNVVRIYEVGRISSEYFLAMELVQGRPMSSLVRRMAEAGKPLDARVAAFVIAQAAHGLHHAHELVDPLGNPLGLVHRDVSPQNILLSFEGSVKVIDFGIARALGRITDTQTGSMKGKFGYMSPEQAKGEEVDKRTDIFALGVVLWEAVTGRRLFSRDNDLATMRALIYDSIPKPSSVLSIPPELEGIILRALSRNAKARFQTGADLAAALEKFVVQAGGASTTDVASVMKTAFATELASWQQTMRAALSAAPASPPSMTVAVPTASSATPTMPPPPVTGTNVSADSSRARWPVFAAAIVGALIVGTGAVLLTRPARPPAPAAATAPPPAPAPAAGTRVEAIAPPSPVQPPAINAGGAAGAQGATSTAVPADDGKRGKAGRKRTRAAEAYHGPLDQPIVPAKPIEKRPNPF
jgi:serine/threonine-protein kinase